MFWATCLIWGGAAALWNNRLGNRTSELLEQEVQRFRISFINGFKHRFSARFSAPHADATSRI